MASGLQCPGCGHVHPAGLPEIARGDATFRCYGCYRTLSIPEGWSDRRTARPPSADPTVTRDGPGTRDARSARLAARGRARPGARGGPASGEPTQMVPSATPDDGPADSDWPSGVPLATGAGTAADFGPAADGATGRPAAAAATQTIAGSGATARAGWRPASGRAGAAPIGWVAPRRSGTPVPTAMRAGVWAGAFFVGLLISAFVLRKMGILDVDRVIDLYAGSGPGRFGILLLLLPMWALLSATIAHLSLETLAKRRRPRTPSRPPANTTSV